MGTDKEIVDKRQSKLGATGDILGGKAGRKVFTGIWVLIFANVWFGLTIYLHSKATIPADVGLDKSGYLVLSLAGILLIGFGTILDTFFADLGHKVVDVIGMVVGSRVAVITSKIEKVQEKTSAVITSESSQT